MVGFINELNSSLGDGRIQLVVNEDNSLGYKLDGADTVYPFSISGNISIGYSHSASVYKGQSGDSGTLTKSGTITLIIDSGKITDYSTTNSGGSAVGVGGWDAYGNHTSYGLSSLTINNVSFSR